MRGISRKVAPRPVLKGRGGTGGGLLVAFMATGALAQATAQINGTVKDSSGGVLPGASVSAIQTETGFKREAIEAYNAAVTGFLEEGRENEALSAMRRMAALDPDPRNEPLWQCGRSV